MNDLLKADSVHVVYITLPCDEADKMAKRLVDKRLAACVSVTRKIESYYWWKGKVKQDEESLLICKTTEAKVSALMEYVHKTHPYDVPEIISFPVANGLPDYLAWVHQETEG